MSDVQIAVIDQQDTQIVLAVPGVQGATGSSIPSGGTADQVLRKNSSTDYDANWTQVTSAMIANGTIVNEDINNSAAIAGTKISPDFGGQAVTTTGQINGARVNVTGNTVPSNGLYLPSANNVALSTNGTGKLFIDTNGNVTLTGAGTGTRYLALLNETSAYAGSYVLQAGGGSAGFGGAITMYGHSHSSYPGSVYIGTSAGSGGSIILGTNNALDPASEKLRITSAGLVGVGTSSPIAQLHVDGSGSQNIRVSSTTHSNFIQAGCGSGSTYHEYKSVYRLVDTDNGERLRITSAGLVGIGTSSPGSKLHIAGGATVVSIGSNDAGDTGAAIFYGTGTKYNWKIGAQQNVDNGFEITPSTAAGGTTFTTPALAVNPSGQVGIGTTSPQYPLDVTGTGNGGILADGSIRAYSANRTAYLSVAYNGFDVSTNSGGMLFTVNQSEAAQIDSSKRLLVGTSSGSGNNLLQIQGEVGSSAGIGGIVLRRGLAPSLLGSGSIMGRIDFGPNDGGIGASIVGEGDAQQGTNDYPSRLVFSTTADGASSPTERMRITNGGEIQFGNTTNGAYTVTRNPGTCAYFDRRTSDGVVISFERQGSGVGNISVTTTATAYNTSSDYRLKENVTPVADGITRLQQLKPSRFNFIADPDKTVDGFIAHEVQTIVPEAITGEKDAVDDEGNPVYQGIDQSKLVPLLTAALQEAIAKIETLEAKVAALESA